MDLLALRPPDWAVHRLDTQGYKRLYDAPNLDGVRFGTRALIEGLLAHGILKPADSPALLRALGQHAIVPAFQERLLESLYNEERIHNVELIVRGKWALSSLLMT